MARELSEEQFVERLKTRESGKHVYLYQVGVLATANEHYVKYTYNYILNNETEDAGNGKLQLKGIMPIHRSRSYKYAHSQTAQNGSGRGEVCP